MREYKYKISQYIFTMVVSIVVFAVFFMGTANGTKYNLIVSSFVLLSITLIYVNYMQIKFNRMYKVYVDEEMLIVNICKGWVSEEYKMHFEDITIIRCYRKYIVLKKINICTKYKSVTLTIKHFKNYKEMLRTIIERTENNKKITIEQSVYDLLI